MTATRILFMKSRLNTNTKNKSFLKRSRYPSKPLQDMSKALVRELDLKMQQVREYALITHGYHNENLQYPVHVRRSHDGEKVPRTAPIVSHRKKTRSTDDSTILTPSSHENRTKMKQKDPTPRHFSYDERHANLIIPPNKTINDIHPSHRKSSLSSTNSSPILCSTRPHSIAGISLPNNEEQQQQQQQNNSLSNSSQSLLNQSPTSTTKTLTQRFFSKFFHHPSKS